jgi:hypothetical protein
MAWKSREAMLAGNRAYYAKNKATILEKQKAYRRAHAEEIAAKSREKYLATRDKALAQRKARYAKKRDIERKQQAEYRAANLEAIRAQQKAYRDANREELQRRCRERRAADPEAYRAKERARVKTPEQRAADVERVRKWQEENRERHREWMRNNRKRRMASEPTFKATIAMRRRFYMAIRNQVYDGWNIRSGQAVRLLGCTMAEFVDYIESLWSDGMTWENWTRDGWHIDHIVPLAAFDLSDEEQVKAACHHTNLRPLWAKDNLRKGAKVDVSIARKDAEA